MVRSVEIGLAGSQADDVAPGGAQLGGSGGYREGGRGLDALNPSGELDVQSVSLIIGPIVKMLQ